MIKKLNQLRLVVLLASLSVSVCQAADSFLVKKKGFKKARMSKRTLKENIGEQTQSSFDLTTELGKELGTLLVSVSSENEKQKCVAKENQEASEPGKNKKTSVVPLLKPIGAFQINLSTLQSKFSRMAERLINNQRPFKKASRDNLKATFALVKKVRGSLTSQLTTVRSVKQNFDVKNMQQCVSNIKKVLDDIGADACLKNI